MTTDRQQLEELTRQYAGLEAAWSAQRESLSATIAAQQVALTALQVEFAAHKSDYHALAQATGVLQADRDAKGLRVLELEAAVNRLTNMLWGRRSERRTYCTTQTELDFGGDGQSAPGAVVEAPSPEIISAEQAAQAAYDQAKLAELEARRQARRKRRKDVETFPPHMERRVRVLDLPEAEKVGLELLGVKVTERLRFEKPIIYIEQIQRPEYVKRDAPELGVQSVPPPPAIVEGCKYDFSVIAAIITMKLAFHTPTYRQQDWFGQSGWSPSRSTSNDLINYAVECIDPLFAQLWHSLLQQPILLGDATTVTVLLREEVGPANQEVLDARNKNREKQREKLRDALRSPVAGENSPSSAGPAVAERPKAASATSYVWLYAGLDAPAELLVQPQPTNITPGPAATVEMTPCQVAPRQWPAVQAAHEEPLPCAPAANESPPSQAAPNESPPSESPPGNCLPAESPPDFSAPRWQSAPYNVFHWSLSQENSVIDGHLENFEGKFVGDSAGVNARLSERSAGRIQHQSCNAHARRKFVEAESNAPLLASQMESLFRQLYAVEFRAVDLTVAERLELRRRQAVPIWEQIAAWLERPDVKAVLPKSSLGKAIGYLRNQWASLRLYLTDGALPMDNNISERIIRPLTIGRKNWLFLGSVESAPGRMKLYSVVSSAQRHCLSVQDYLEDVLLKLSQAAQHRPQDLEIGSELLLSLLPDRWAATHPQHVQRGRQEERQQVAESKQYYRLQAGLAGRHPYGAHNLASAANQPSGVSQVAST